MDPSEAANIQQYIQMFGHPPPGVNAQQFQAFQLAQALQAGKTPSAAPAAPPVTAPQSITQAPARMAAQEAANQ
jgi:hypothetical protein